MRLLSKEEVLEQSDKAYERWKHLWEQNAIENSSRAQNNEDISRIGLDRKIFIISRGVSILDNIEGIKRHKLHYECDIMCIDKSLKICLENGILPKYCVISDAQVSFEEYGKIDPLFCKNVILFSAVTANYEWTKYWIEHGGKVYFYLNKDNIRTHHIYGKFMEGKQAYLIPASSNVGNAAYVIATMLLNYKRIFLAAYDYSFSLLGEYYGAEKTKPIDTNLKLSKKTFYNHYTMVDIAGNLVQCSHNMQFSAKWLIGFIEQMQKRGVDTINATGAGILKIQKQARLRKEAA